MSTQLKKALCDEHGCYRTIAPSRTKCYVHVPRLTNAEQEAENRRLEAVSEARRWHNEQKKLRKLADRVLDEGKEFDAKYGGNFA